MQSWANIHSVCSVFCNRESCVLSDFITVMLCKGGMCSVFSRFLTGEYLNENTISNQKYVD